MKPTITMSDVADMQVRDAIGSRLGRYNEQGSGQPDITRPLVLTLTDLETAEVIGGLWGGTGWDHLHVDMLFVPETLRGSGIGRELMHQAEEAASRRGCRGIWLETFSFQARGFYERLGYTIFGTIDHYPPGHSRFFLKKTIAPYDPLKA